jgi:hypothetical protein
MALTDLARVKLEQGIGDVTYDALLTGLIDSVSVAMNRWMGRSIESATYTSEKYDSPRSHELLLRQWPIITTTVVLEGTQTLVLGTDYERELERGILIRISGIGGAPISWRSSVQIFDEYPSLPRLRHISVTYTAGYATIPTDLAEAATLQVRHLFQQTIPGGGRLGLDRKAIDTGGETGYVASGAQFLPGVIEVMNQYRRWAP